MDMDTPGQEQSFKDVANALFEELARDIKEAGEPESFGGFVTDGWHAAIANRTSNIAAVSSLIIIFMGILLSFIFDAPTWLSRIATVVIVVGIFSSMSKAHTLIKMDRTLQIFEENLRNARSYRRGKIKRHHPEMTAEDVERELLQNENNAISQWRAGQRYAEKRMFWMEAIILSAGTLLNGFGDWIIGWAVSAVWSI